MRLVNNGFTMVGDRGGSCGSPVAAGGRNKRTRIVMLLQAHEILNILEKSNALNKCSLAAGVSGVADERLNSDTSHTCKKICAPDWGTEAPGWCMQVKSQRTINTSFDELQKIPDVFVNI
jgi:hypothetical protein